MLRAISFTPAARVWLAQTTSARVLNSFDRACNLVNQDDAILALVTSKRGLNPFAVVVASDDPTALWWPFRGLSPASRVKVAGDCLWVGDAQIDLASARLWQPSPDWPVVRKYFASDPARLGELADAVMQLKGEGSLLDLFGPPPALGATLLRPAGEGWGGGVLNRARRGAEALVRGLLAGSPDERSAGAKLLAGLGGGLTPAGDDFIVGVLLAAWAGLYGEGQEQSGTAIAETGAPLTTTLSAAYLRAAAKGECMAHWHALFEALGREEAEATREAIRALLSIGHTSGADALAGFLAVHFLTPGPSPGVKHLVVE